MKRRERYYYKQQRNIRFLIALLIVLIWLVAIIYLSTLKSTIINLPICILSAVFVLLGFFLSYLNNRAPERRDIKNKTATIEIILLVLSLYLMVKNYTVYGVWDLIFKVIRPSIIVGFIFLFALTLGIILPNKTIRLILIPVVSLYPLRFLNSQKVWLVYGAIIGALWFVEFFYSFISNLKTNKHLSEVVNKKLICEVLKLLLPLLVISIAFYFGVGHESISSYSNAIYIQKKLSLYKLLPLLILVVFLVLSINPKISLLCFLVGNMSTTLLISDLTNVTFYNQTTFLLGTLRASSQTVVEILLLLIVQALTTALVLISISFCIGEWRIFNLDFKLLNNLKTNVNLFKNNSNHALKILIFKATIARTYFFDVDTMDLEPFYNTKNTYYDEWLHKHILVLHLKKIFALFWPINEFIVGLVYTSYFFNNFKIEQIQDLYLGMFTIYFNILVGVILICWSNIQNHYLGHWFGKKTTKQQK